MRLTRVSIKLVSYFLASILIAVSSAACKESSEKRTVSVLYAGSLATVMENGLGPAFSKASGAEYKGEAQGSLGGARMIHDHLRTPDVFISADPAVNETVLMGDGNGNLVTWFATLASSQLVLAYNPKSPFAEKFKAAADNQLPWYELLATPGLRFGRGDPTIDPKGYRTLFLFDLAARHYQKPEIAKLIGDTLNPEQVLPEVALLARVEAGQFDAGIFYRHEVVAHKLPYVTFPAEINLGDPKFSEFYAQATYTTPKGDLVRGAPIIFTITIPNAVQHPAAAEEMVRFLLSSAGLLEEYGLGKVDHLAGGDPNQIPAGLRSLCSGKYKPDAAS